MTCAEKLGLGVRSGSCGGSCQITPQSFHLSRPVRPPGPYTGRDLWCPLVAALRSFRCALARSLDFQVLFGIAAVYFSLRVHLPMESSNSCSILNPYT